MDTMERCKACGLVPVVVIEDANDAVPTARALLAGGIDTMEITFRTAAAKDAIRAVAQQVPEILVGAGTVTTLKQCKEALEAGAKFIVSPGFDPETVDYCVEHSVPVLPGCVTPTEIMAAKKRGLNVIKFFPANVYGGQKGMKALSGPFPGLQFLPTGGVNGENIQDYIRESFIAAVGGSWVCTKADIAAHNFDRITALCRQAREAIDAARSAK
ncbi:MAG: bifunctional 4-hydroxy-2-oxoglutarate aldolase/2-dehydro-3-deoxy-phosphogluconate aldolase [Clostridia bacterium]|nr:bifunctional 4-hydroxy-2-oxoglutarate aldolase/2-dehydro-3-deoxy-phosphogluconate aldolase [Clostridia bacterium]